MSTPSEDAAKPTPVRLVLPADPALGQPEQEVVARLWGWRQPETGWGYLVRLASYWDREDGGVEAAEYPAALHSLLLDLSVMLRPTGAFA
ncbi:hypothetical protein H8N00_11160 [Streptomyces sp. AC563]|uniref:hypothetical protein n=1 Tax=Streptomyces buecherae TaxID=2763006 RepID=UPI00164D5468|nr:hypothetical protein [Streptomyces buecherae]MBC3989426.1 hypothetical protein [Streptomyces buecherae]